MLRLCIKNNFLEYNGTQERIKVWLQAWRQETLMGKLCPRGKAAAKRKFKVYPSAYANAYGVKVCKGQVKAGGKKKTAPGYSKAKRR